MAVADQPVHHSINDAVMRQNLLVLFLLNKILKSKLKKAMQNFFRMEQSDSEKNVLVEDKKNEKQEVQDQLQIANVASDSEATNTNTTSSYKRGRVLSTVWSMFTDAPNPQQIKSALCKHCKTVVNHHKKSECAQTHLNHCKPFVKLMMGKDIADRPEWFCVKKLKIS